MVSNKKRLYIALYPSGVSHNGQQIYDWGFLVGPKNERGAQVPGMRYRVKNHTVNSWVYEEAPLSNVRSTEDVLARVRIAKVKNEKRLVKIIRNTPVIQGDSWVAKVLYRIAKDGKAVGTAELNWERIETVSRAYVASKAAMGRYNDVEDMALPRPTWDMLQGREVIP